MSDAAVALERLPAGRGTARGGHIPTRVSASLVVLDVVVACPPEGKVWVCGGGHGPRDSQPCCSFSAKPVHLAVALSAEDGKGQLGTAGLCLVGSVSSADTWEDARIAGQHTWHRPPETLALAE